MPSYTQRNVTQHHRWRAKEPSYFFKLSEWGDRLIELYAKEDALGPKSRRNEVLSFLENEDLRDLSISRTTFDWGLKVPGDDEHAALQRGARVRSSQPRRQRRQHHLPEARADASRNGLGQQRPR